MKRYKELCHFVDQAWQPVGFTLFDTVTNCYKFLSVDQFNKAVQQNEIQYFVWDTATDSLAIVYTNEELRDNRIFTPDFANYNKHQTLESYLENDAKAPYYFFDYLTSKQNLIMGLCTGLDKVPIVGYVVSIYLIGGRNDISKLFEDLGKEAKELIQEEEFGVRIKYPIKKIKDKNAELKFADMLISTEGLKRTEIASGRKNKKSTVSDSEVYDVLKIIKFFDQITEQTINKYKSYISADSYYVESKDVTDTINKMHVF